MFFWRSQTVVILELIESICVAMQRQLGRIERIIIMAQADLERLKASVERNTSATASALALIQGMSQQLRDAKDDPEEIAALADMLDSQATALSEAVTANTPVAEGGTGEGE